MMENLSIVCRLPRLELTDEPSETVVTVMYIRSIEDSASESKRPVQTGTAKAPPRITGISSFVLSSLI
jgi:hypothetical protein